MIVWRLIQKRFSTTPLSAEGARLYGGRWNSPGRSVLYTSSSPSLAALEVFVHLPAAARGRPFLMVQLEVPSTEPMDTRSAADLPKGWFREPLAAASQSVGDDWVAEGKSLGLLLPSAIVPQDSNVLLNASHKSFDRVKVITTAAFVFDDRVWKG